MDKKERKTTYPTKDDYYKIAKVDMVITINGHRTANKPVLTTFYLKDVETIRKMFEALYAHKIDLIYHEI